MKIGIRTLMFVTLTGLVGATTANAQVTETMQFKTAFPFTVGNTTYPAGTFTVKPADDGDNTVLEISDGKTTTLLEVQPETAGPNQRVNDEVVFKKYGNQYVLCDIWDQADGSGVRTETSRAEQRYAKKHGAEPTRESVSASRGLSSKS
jgi:hypothetical protein